MQSETNGADFSDAIDALRAQRGDSVAISEIAEVVESLLQTMDGDVSALDLRVYRDLDSLAKYVRRARAEIFEIQPADIQETHIPRATDELDAIVSATEDATGTILDAAETLTTLADGADKETRRQLMDVATRIYEACSFQDITGQRITKVVKTLKHIEAELDKIVAVFGDEIRGQSDGAAKAKPDGNRDTSLLNGPQLSEKAATQEEIDALLASFN